MGQPVQRTAERARLQAVRALGLIGAEPNSEMADAAALARDQFSVPIALISLMDEEQQVFIARCGVKRTEAPRSAVFCDHVVNLISPLVVLDARRDPRFMNNPFVVGPPYVRFYAGEPLLSADGLCLGTMCIVDTEPRAEFSDEDHAKLQRLARLAAQVLRVRAACAARDDALIAQAESERRLCLIIDEASAAISSCDRLAAYVQRRLAPSLARAHAYLANLANAAASLEVRRARISALSELSAAREFADDLASIARCDGQLAKGHFRAYQPSAILGAVVHDLIASAAARGVSFQLDDRTAGFEIVGDEVQLEELLDQFLSDLAVQSQNLALNLSCHFQSPPPPARSLLVVTVAADPASQQAACDWRLSDHCRDLIEAIGGAWDDCIGEQRLSIYLPARLRLPVRARSEGQSNVVSFTQVQGSNNEY